MHWIDSQRSDDFISTPSRNGQFSLKFAYSLIAHSSGSVMGSPALWKKLWKSRLHNRLKFLLWKILTGALPTRKLLAWRFHVDNSLCPFCSQAEEDVIHLFFLCSFARALLFSLPLTVRWDHLISFTSIYDHFTATVHPEVILPVHKTDSNSFLLFAALLFEKIWACRNNLVSQSQQLDISHIALCLRNGWEEFSFSINSIQDASCTVQNVAAVCWCPPTSYIKNNVDVTIRGELSFLEVVACNWRGEVLKLLIRKDHISVVEAAEAKAPLLAL